MPAVPDPSLPDDSPGWAGALGPLLALPGVTDVLVNGPADVWVDRGEGLERADLGIRAGLATPRAVRDLAVRLASLAGRRLDDAAPCVDGRLPDGSRLHAVLPPVADGCAALSIRRLRAGALDPRELIATGMVSDSGMAELRALVRARASLLISGATGSGKTTLLTALLSLAAPTERIVVIEEAGEVAPDHPHVVRLVERRANVDGAGAVPLSALVREALRMRPDRVVLGECRGAELREVLLAFNTGHRGGLVTMHANSAADVPARLTALGALAGMGADAVALHAAAAFDAVIHLERGKDGVRRVVEVTRLVLDDGRLVVGTASVREPARERGPAATPGGGA
ncbi:TadA family conjugal transfer-associated ATPase [Demequina salsinemoris]|uniref:TadA family conjugal transfer-associated ATPase n=1 Tax=Demequina salsinemoris TaxID=577470 RepID=UPI000781886C|nr:TadA family conjugal transfer-associated ATPase [Demequina salsinemoris]